MVSLYNPIGSPRYKVYWLLLSVTETKISHIANDIYDISDKTITSLVITIPNWFLIVFCYLMLIALALICIFFQYIFQCELHFSLVVSPQNIDLVIIESESSID